MSDDYEAKRIVLASMKTLSEEAIQLWPGERSRANDCECNDITDLGRGRNWVVYGDYGDALSIWLEKTNLRVELRSRNTYIIFDKTLGECARNNVAGVFISTQCVSQRSRNTCLT